MPSDAPAPTPLLLSTREAALACRLCEKTIRLMVKSGALPAVRVGLKRRGLRIDPRDITAWIDRAKGGDV